MSEFAELVRDAKALMSNIESYAANIRPSDPNYDKAEALWNGINKGLEDADEKFINKSFDKTVLIGVSTGKSQSPTKRDYLEYIEDRGMTEDELTFDEFKDIISDEGPFPNKKRPTERRTL